MFVSTRVLGKSAFFAAVIASSFAVASAQSSGSFSYPVYYDGTNIGTVAGPVSTSGPMSCGPNGQTYTQSTYTFEGFSISDLDGGGALSGSAVYFSVNGGNTCPQGGWQTPLPVMVQITNGSSQCTSTANLEKLYFEFYGTYAQLIVPNKSYLGTCKLP